MSAINTHNICQSGCLQTPHTASIDGVNGEFIFCCKRGAGKYKRQYSQYLKNKRNRVKYNFKPINEQGLPKFWNLLTKR